MKAYNCEACKDTGCKNGFDHDGCGAGVIGPDPEPCTHCNEGDVSGKVAEQKARVDEWNRSLEAQYSRF